MSRMNRNVRILRLSRESQSLVTAVGDDWQIVRRITRASGAFAVFTGLEKGALEDFRLVCRFYRWRDQENRFGP